ncbi:unnamed protein product, partial [Amoebophrya sp. A25]
GQPVDVPESDAEYFEGVRKKFRTLLLSVEEHNRTSPSGIDLVRTLLLCDIGCGVYGNDPRIVGSLFGEVLCELAHAGQFRTLDQIVISGKKAFFDGIMSREVCEYAH